MVFQNTKSLFVFIVKKEESSSSASSTTADKSFEPHLERADSVRLLKNNQALRQNVIAAANAALYNDNDANDDEVGQITSGNENSFVSTSNSKPGLLPYAQANALNATLKLGLPQQGTFSDAHDGQKASPNADPTASVSTQNELPSAHVIHKSLSGENCASFAPISAQTAQYSSAFVDQQATKSIGKEQI